VSRSKAREQIASYLVHNGPIDDPAGRATAKLKERVGYQGSDAGFTQLIAAMAAAGELTREVKGKRTYRIAAGVALPSATDDSPATNHIDLSDAPSSSEQQSSSGQELDYDEMAAALLAKVVQTLSAGTGQTESDGSWARRRIERLERRNAELERELLQATTEVRALAGERDELKLRLEHTEGNLEILSERLTSGKPSDDGHASKRLRA